MSERVGGEPVVKLCNLFTEFGIILRHVADVKLRIGGNRAYAFWSHAQAVALKRSARGDEGRLRGLAQPAKAGFALLARALTRRAS
jgi:hypothetical protein